MKIAFVSTIPIVSSTNGVRMQALTWKKGLEDAGHEVDLIDLWNVPDWTRYDIIQFFGYGASLAELAPVIGRINPNLVLAPIIDSVYSVRTFRWMSKFGSQRLRLTNSYNSLRRIRHLFKLYLVRSEYEKKYVTGAYGIPDERVAIVPLSYRLDPPSDMPVKELFCLHVSLLADERKNVKRLIEAAEKYDFKLILGGNVRGDIERKKLEAWIGDSANVKYTGFLSDHELAELYTKAKVFALPSTNEGVGLVALDAAVFGCDIVVTNIGGPKEYYTDLAIRVDPYSVDAIGLAIKSFIDGQSFQPALRQYITENYALQATMTHLEDAYRRSIK